MPKSWLVRGAESAERARRRMELTGITPNGHPLWQPEEVAPVVAMYPDYPSIFPLVESRTHPAVYKKAGRLGITKRRAPPWSDNEILRLRKVYPHGTRDQVRAAFPGRSNEAIAKAANARGIFRAPPPLPSTGNRLLDQILTRARKMGFSKLDLDALGRCKGYFAHRRWRTKLDERLHCIVARQMGGTIRAEFD